MLYEGKDKANQNEMEQSKRKKKCDRRIKQIIKTKKNKKNELLWDIFVLDDSYHP